LKKIKETEKRKKKKVRGVRVCNPHCPPSAQDKRFIRIPLDKFVDWVYTIKTPLSRKRKNRMTVAERIMFIWNCGK